MFYLFVELHQRKSRGFLFTQLDGNGSTCGPFGNSCSPQASGHSHGARDTRPGVILKKNGSFLKSVFGGGGGIGGGIGGGGHSFVLGHHHSEKEFIISTKRLSFSGFGGSGGLSLAIPQKIHVTAGNGFGGGSKYFKNGYGSVHSLGTIGHEGGIRVSGIWHSSHGGVEFTGTLLHGKLMLSHLRAVHGSINSGISTGHSASWLLSDKSKLRSTMGAHGASTSLSEKTWKKYLDSKGLAGTHVSKAKVIDGVHHGHHHGKHQHKKHGKIKAHHHAVLSVMNKDMVDDQNLPGDWWDHGKGSKFLAQMFGLPKSIGKVDAGLSTGGIKVTKQKNKSGLDCHGTCFYAPDPMTQSTIAVYHSI